MFSIKRSARLRQVTVRPPHWEVAFGRCAPLEVDLGSGRGSYVLERARLRPDRDLVAIETRLKWVRLVRQRSRELGLSNLRVLRCDASQDLDILFQPESVAGFTIHHPDPWWKKRHRKRRLVKPELVDLLVTLLEPGGFIYLQTDVPDLAREARQIMAAHPRLQEVEAARFRQQVLGGSASHREKRCRELGIPISRLAFLKKKPRQNPT